MSRLPPPENSSPTSLLDLLDSRHTTDEFRMFSFKVRPCSRTYSHDWTECPFVHPGEKSRRRDPRKYHYSCSPCPDFESGACRRGDLCEYAHGVFECWLHPVQYRTRLCKDGDDCTRRVCFFAHSQNELRPLCTPSPRSDSKAVDFGSAPGQASTTTHTAPGRASTAPPLTFYPRVSSPRDETGERRRSYEGVHKQVFGGMWVAEIWDPCMAYRIWLGKFSTAEEAAHTYDMAAFRLHGSRARLNFPEDAWLYSLQSMARHFPSFPYGTRPLGGRMTVSDYLKYSQVRPTEYQGSGNGSNFAVSWSGSTHYHSRVDVMDISLEELNKVSGMKLEDAAQKLNVSVSKLKHACRHHHISRWPSRKRKIDHMSRSDDYAQTASAEEIGGSFPSVQSESQVTIKAQDGDHFIKFRLSTSSVIDVFDQQVSKRLKLEKGNYRVKYQDDDKDWILVACDEDLKDYISSSMALGKTNLIVSIERI